MEKHVYKSARKGFATMSLSLKENSWSGNTFSQVKNITGRAVIKGGHTDSVLRHERISHNWFSATVKSVFYYQLLRQNSPYLLNDPFMYVPI